MKFIVNNHRLPEFILPIPLQDLVDVHDMDLNLVVGDSRKNLTSQLRTLATDSIQVFDNQNRATKDGPDFDLIEDFAESAVLLEMLTFKGGSSFVTPHIAVQRHPGRHNQPVAVFEPALVLTINPAPVDLSDGRDSGVEVGFFHYLSKSTGKHESPSTERNPAILQLLSLIFCLLIAYDL